jgi:hypothetical protein
LTLESIRTEMTTSRGYKSPCIFIEVVLLFILRFSWDSRFSEYRTLQKSVVVIKEI